MKRDWVYVGGTFDLFHPGHVNLLWKAKAYGPVVVALNTDAFAESYKRRPIMTLAERTTMLESCSHVDEVVVNTGGEDSRWTIDSLAMGGMHVRYVLHGDDWVGENLKRQMGLTEGWLASRGIELLYVPYTEGVSSSEIEGRVIERNAEKEETTCA